MPVIDIDYEKLDPYIQAEVNGHSLSRPAVRKLEKQLQADPDDLLARLTVLGYYQMIGWKTAKAAESYAEHLIWLIDNRPADPMHGFVLAPLQNKAAMRRIKARWLRQVRLHSKNVSILDHAAHACEFTAADDVTAEKLWKRAMKLQPRNEDFLRNLSFIYQLRASDGSLTRRRKVATTAVEYFFKALKLHRKYPCQSYLQTDIEMIVGDLAELSLKLKLLDHAEKLAQVLLDLKPIRRTMRYRKVGKTMQWTMYKEARYKGEAIMGKVAMLAGDVDAAKASLAKMRKLSAPRRLDWELAQLLLDSGERDAVIKHLEALRRHNSKERERLDRPETEANLQLGHEYKRTKPEVMADWRAALDARDEQYAEQIQAIKNGKKSRLGDR